MEVTVSHKKRLGDQQFEGIKGSPQHAMMSMNRVWVDFKFADDFFARWKARDQQVAAITLHLTQSCKDYYFIGRMQPNDFECRVYFLSEIDMYDFIVWTKMAIPCKDNT